MSYNLYALRPAFLVNGIICYVALFGCQASISVVSNLAYPEAKPGEHYVDWYSMNVSAGDRVLAELDSADFSPYLIAQPSGGPRLESGSKQGTSKCMLLLENPISGNLQLGVSSKKPGARGQYSLKADIIQPLLEQKESLSRRDKQLADRFVDWHYLYLSRTAQLEIQAHSSQFNIDLIVYNPEKKQFDAQYCQSHQKGLRCLFPAAARGRYRIGVSSQKKQAIGAYTLKATARTPNKNQALYSKQDILQIDNPSQKTDWHFVKISDSESGLVVELTSQEFRPQLIIESPDMDLERVESKAPTTGAKQTALFIQPKSGGMLRIGVRGNEASSKGRYSLHVYKLDQAKTILENKGQLSRSDSHLHKHYLDTYFFEVPQTARVILEAQSNRFSPELQVTFGRKTLRSELDPNNPGRALLIFPVSEAHRVDVQLSSLEERAFGQYEFKAGYVPLP